jgi:Ser/Thr protein kinase RdoA (MazF antagonist)
MALNPDLRPLHARAQLALQHYNLPPLHALKMVNLSENATFKLTVDDGRSFALRLHRPGYHTRAAIQSELAWLMALRRDGVATTPIPVAGKDGELIQHVDGHHVVLSVWESGVEPAIDQDLSAAFATLGEVAARMHLHVQHWSRPPDFERFTWDFESSLGETAPHWGRWQQGMGVDAAKRKLFGRTVDLIGRRLGDYGKDAQRFGLVHGDLRLANLLLDGEQVKVIDFDDSGFSWFMYDAATPVSFHEHEPQVPALLEAWKQGYRRVMPLAKADETEIPSFVMLRRLLLVAWIGSHHETELAQRMGVAYTEGTVGLCEAYLARMS